MLAFVHIEKTAGTTLIHILRRNFFPRYMDVRPLTKPGDSSFTAYDLRTTERLNPLLTCIGGHSVTPHAELEAFAPNIRYITLLRDPVERYVSQFRYWNRKLGKGITFEEFLADEGTWNVQTKKISGSDDPELAKDFLSTKFLLAGVVEEFDEFLVLLQRKLLPMDFDPSYRVKNAGVPPDTHNEELTDHNRDEIGKRNFSDIELYNYVQNQLIPKQRHEYGLTLAADVMKLRGKNASAKVGMTKSYADFLVRKAYYEPATGLIRRMNDLPYRGSYRK